MSDLRNSHAQGVQDGYNVGDRRQAPQPHRPAEARSAFFDARLIGNRYRFVSIIGEGAYGVVCSAIDIQTGEKVAVKRIRRVFDEIPEAVRILRELRFLRLLRSHENIISIREILAPSERDSFDDVFVVFELMPADLNRVLRAPIPLSQDHIRWLMYQLLQALHYMHSCNVLHRDIKPNNIMINELCDLRVIDFGLARLAYNQQEDMACWTDYVATRWYRAPELIMSYSSKYSAAIDIWSAGCIFAELLNRGKPLFPGMNSFEQLELIVKLLGTPDEESIAKVRNQRVRQHLRSLPPRPPKPLDTVFPDAPPDALDLLRNLLQFDPSKRLTALEALQHVYFRGLYTPESIVSGSPLPPEEFFFEREQLTASQMRQLFWEEILHYHPDLRETMLRGHAGGYEIPSEADRFRAALTSQQRDGIPYERAYASMPKEKLATMWNQVEGMARDRPEDAPAIRLKPTIVGNAVESTYHTPCVAEHTKAAGADDQRAHVAAAAVTATGPLSQIVHPQLLRNASIPNMIDVDDDDASAPLQSRIPNTENTSDTDTGDDSTVMMEAQESFGESFREL
jgi:mitogen-activated protein kinase 1/3